MTTIPISLKDGKMDDTNNLEDVVEKRLTKLVEAINEFISAGKEDVKFGDKINLEYTSIMKGAHALAFTAVDVATKIRTPEPKKEEAIAMEAMSRFAAMASGMKFKQA